ncbi:hypothetical protein BDV32DRAFT_117598 [Aspergillus pseudonomiae]|nr:hypothetical protein BDV32DRAFT_117598 [Aspergillus pseudonomiae]
MQYLLRAYIKAELPTFAVIRSTTLSSISSACTNSESRITEQMQMQMQGNLRQLLERFESATFYFMARGPYCGRLGELESRHGILIRGLASSNHNMLLIVFLEALCPHICIVIARERISKSTILSSSLVIVQKE